MHQFGWSYHGKTVPLFKKNGKTVPLSKKNSKKFHYPKSVSFTILRSSSGIGFISFIHRVTIFVKAKIGTTDGHFARDQNFGLFNYSYNKIGTLKFTCRLVSAGNRRGFIKRKETGVISKKKKKKGQHLFSNAFCVTFRPKTAQIVQPNRLWPFFFFFWRSPRKSSSPAWPVMKLFCFSKAKSGICHKKSGTYGNRIYTKHWAKLDL